LKKKKENQLEYNRDEGEGEDEDEIIFDLNNINDKNKIILDNSVKTPKLAVLKLARLGRTSFRAVKSKRDYLKNRTQYNWLYLSRLSAESEFKYMKSLHSLGFPTPNPIDQNRHCILMEFIPSYPLCNVNLIGNLDQAYSDLMNLIVRLASCGLVHGDFNEFNILIDNNQKIYVIDFPQMISISHPEAKKQFERDIDCILNYFKKKFNISFDEKPCFEKDIKRSCFVDVELKAPGFVTPENYKIENCEDPNEKIDLDDEDVIDVIEEMKECNVNDVNEKDKIRDNVKKNLKKFNKTSFKNNRFKNKKANKIKNSLI